MDILALYNQYYHQIYQFALRLSCHPDDAADLTQETFLTALVRLDTLRNEQAAAGWLRTICYHRFIDETRRSRYLTEVDDWEQLELDGTLLHALQPLPETEVIVAEEIRNLQNGCFLAMVRKLTLHQRIAFSLTDMYGMNIEAVADLLGTSVGAAKGLLYRARMNIDSFFAGHCDLIRENNPCSCSAWITFSTNREQMQQSTRKLIEKLDFTKEGYAFDESVRKKVHYLYLHMPDRKPSDEWYQRVLQLLKEN